MTGSDGSLSDRTAHRGGEARPERLDCLVIGGGPAGLTAALYLARFRRDVLVVDAGEPRAAWIPVSHNIPLLPAGVSGPDLLKEMRASAERYGARILSGRVTGLSRAGPLFRAEHAGADGQAREILARRVLLATGSIDIEPDLPDVPDAVRRGLLRYCPICDGFEAAGKAVAVMGRGRRALGEARFIARTYPSRVTAFLLDGTATLAREEIAAAEAEGVQVVGTPIEALEVEGGRISLVRARGREAMRFDILYSALGMRIRSDLALGLGARHDGSGALAVDDHNRTSVPGLYAAGDVVRGLSQIVVAMGQAAVAATDIHNRCHLPTEEEPGAGSAP